MGGCEQCLISRQAQQEQYTITLQKAKRYAKENNKQVAIYKEAYEYHFIDAEIAIREQYPITEIISQYL